MKTSRLLISLSSVLLWACAADTRDPAELAEEAPEETARSEQGASAADSPGEATSPSAATSLGSSTRARAPSQPYTHPLKGAALADGRVPLLDVKNTPDGRRYAVVHGVVSDGKGRVEKTSGLGSLERRAPEGAELTLLRAGDVEPSAPSRAPDVIEPPLAEAIARALAADPEASSGLSVIVALERPFDDGISVPLQRKIAAGEIQTMDDLREAKDALLAERRRGLVLRQRAAAAAIDEVGGAVLYQFQNLHFVTATVPPAGLLRLAKEARERGIRRLALNVPVHDDGVTTIEVRDACQVGQMSDAAYNGEVDPTTSADDVTFAVIENLEFRTSHLGLNDTSSDPSSRIRGMYKCNGTTASGCVQTTSGWAGNSGHPIGVLGAIMGDLEDGQDPAYPSSNVTGRKQRSGYAPESRGYLYSNTNGDVSDLLAAIDQVPNQFYHAHVVSMSLGTGSDPQCLGENAESMAIDELHELGHLPVKSAGNGGPDATNPGCSANSPGAAIGVFTVGAFGNSFSDSADQLRDAFIMNSDACTSGTNLESAMGGTSASEGKWRSVIDMVTPGFQLSRFDYKESGNGALCDGGTTCYRGGTACATSLATPTMAGSSLTFVDWWKTEVGGGFIDSPGALFANMLVMGDRQDGGYTGGDVGARLRSGMSSLYGAGRLKMRNFLDEGMGGAWAYYTFSTCIDAGETYDYTIGVVPAGVDYAKAALYFYDPRLEQGQTISDIHFSFKANTVYSTRDTDNEVETRRIFTDGSDVGGLVGKTLKLSIFGNQVHGTDPTCGANSELVWVSVFYEDATRADAEGPCWDQAGCAHPIEPEDLHD